MLITYQQRTRRLLGDELFKWLRDGDLEDYINEARLQVAGEGECLPDYSQLQVNQTSQEYPFSLITISAVNLTLGYSEVLNVRMGNFSIGSGQKLVYPRAWAWYQLYTLSDPVPVPGPPREFAQQGQGTSGTLWINLVDQSYQLNLDTVCLPLNLVDDTTPDAIPRLWKQAVPYYAAWIAMMTHPSGANPDEMFARYQQMMERARSGAVSQVLPHIQSQGPDLANANRYGISQR